MQQFTVCHMDKAKAGTSGGLTAHIDRTNDKEQGNVYEELKNRNFELVQKTGTIDEMIKSRINEGYQGKKTIRKDAVTSQRYILSGSHEQMTKIGSNPRLIREWANDNYIFFAEKYGEENIIRATVHLDEKTPHMHLIVVPLTPDGRLSAKEFTGTAKKLRTLQNDYAEKIGRKWGLQRGMENSGRKHIETKAFYKYLSGKEMSADWVINHPNRTAIVSKLLAENDKIKALQREKIKSREDNRTKQLHNVKTDKNEQKQGIYTRNQQTRERGERKNRKGRGI